MPSNGALMLLSGEPQGFAIDATTEGGSIAIRDTTTKANNHIIHGVTNAIRNGLDSFNPVRGGSTKLVQSGTSSKMVHFPDSPYVRWSPHNYLQRSQELDDSYWSTGGTGFTGTGNTTTAPDGTTTASTLTENSATSLHSTSKSTANVGNASITVSVYAKKKDRDYCAVGAAGANDGVAYSVNVRLTDGVITDSETLNSPTDTSSSVTSVGNGWYRIVVSFTTTDASQNHYVFLALSDSATPSWTSARPLYTGNGTSGTYFWGVQKTKGLVALPYLVTTSAAVIGIPQSYDATEEQYGILVEPAATNVAINSEAMNSWSPDGATCNANAATAPDGSTTADQFVEDGGSSNKLRYQGCTITSGVAWTWSFYAKYVTRQWIKILNYDGADHYSWFDIQNGVTGTNESGNTSTITLIGNGWYRCTVTRTTASTAGYIQLGLASADNVKSYTGDGASSAYFWGAQVELGTVATSYIPTLGSTVTRAADNVIALISSLPYGATSNTAYVSAKTRVLGVEHEVLEFDANNANIDECIKLFIKSNNETAIYDEAGGGNYTNQITNYSAVANTMFQITGAWATNSIYVSAEGIASANDLTAVMPTVTHLRLGCDPTPANHLNGFIYKIVHTARHIETVTGDLENWRYVA